MCSCLGNRAFIIVDDDGHGSFENYHTEMVCCYVHFVRIRIFVIVAFCMTWELKFLEHRNINAFKFSCIEIKEFIIVAAGVSESRVFIIDAVTGHGNLQYYHTEILCSHLSAVC